MNYPKMFNVLAMLIFMLFLVTLLYTLQYFYINIRPNYLLNESVINNTQNINQIKDIILYEIDPLSKPKKDIIMVSMDYCILDYEKRMVACIIE